MTYKTLASRLVYENRWMRVREDEIERADGTAGIYGVVEKVDFVVVLPIEDGHVYLVSQYRYPLGRRCLELPQGSWELEPDADPTTVALGELREETGLVAGRMERLGFADAASGHATQGFHVFLATELTPGPSDVEPEEQDLEVHRLTLDEFVAGMREGRITDAHTLAAYALYQLRSR
ncbi:MAG: NUDIX hydrolase [Alphaproteobacteria bacterium]|jgi:8-oxo-dGTP pyrophosphatase MutT (NUDIX family)|nr:NUDIX hydrolase [Alphaproteobacteria bacterium]